jgi:alpha-1,3-fucosyltransferase
MKTILLWTTWYTRHNGFDFGYGPEKFQTCPIPECQLTSDRALFNESSAVMFQTQVWDWNATDLPKYRFPHQRFIKYNYEPELFSLRTIYDSTPPHFYNWTYTYRRDSDIVGFRYGVYRFIPESMNRTVWSGSYEEEESLENYYGVNITGKSIMAAWFVSHCETKIGREQYVAELQKYIRVDVYGDCGTYTCKGNEHSNLSDRCEERLKKNYLFYLSFENNFCPDYVTEKLFRGFLSETVPVVLGGAHYSRFAPPHSYIDVLDYESPKKLADYLKKLSNNRRLYSHYFEWRRHFRMQEKMPIDSWCNLCQMLHDQSLPSKSYANITKWWFDDYPCNDHSWKDKAFQIDRDIL